jgi:hypothetical protein
VEGTEEEEKDSREELNNHNLVYTECLKAYIYNINRLYGFTADPTKSKNDNFNSAITTYITQPTSMLLAPGIILILY